MSHLGEFGNALFEIHVCW